MSDQPERGTTALSETKSGLLDKWLSGDGRPAAPAAVIHPRPGPGPAPLSLVQQRLWFIEQLQPGTSAYNLAFCARIGIELDPVPLGRCVAELVARHETLRTAVRTENGIPVAIDGAHPELKIVDLRTTAGDAGVDAAVRTIREAADTPFDLHGGPVARILLCRLDGRSVLGIVVHHLFADGWSLGVALGELSAAYQGHPGGAPAPLPFQYTDFAAWQEDSLRDGNRPAELEYWRGQLTGVPALELPNDRPRPPVAGTGGDWVELGLTEALSDSVRELARAADATPFMVLLAAWQLLLGELSGQRDVAVGANVADRARPGTPGLIGNFTNMLALRTDLDGDPTFRELLDRARRTCLAAFGHQTVPFEWLIRELQPERDPSRPILLQALFVLQPPIPSPEFAGVPMEVLDVSARSARADLELHLRDTPAISGHVSYSTDLFDAGTAERVVHQLETLLANVVGAPERRLSQLSVVTAEERDLFTNLGHGEVVEVPPEPVHELVRRQASLTPSAIAVVSGPERMDYAMLEHRSGQLAGHLRRLGVGPEIRVAVCLSRSTSMIVAVLAVLRAGGAYVPLDPGNPPERLLSLVDASRSRVVLTETGFAGAFRGAPEMTVVCLDGEPDVFDGSPTLDAEVPADPDGLAYVVFTSGSTGEPKGVAATHRCLSNLVVSVLRGQEPGDVMAVVANLAFDASVAEIFPVLTTGGAIVLASVEQVTDANLLRRLVLTHRVSALLATPTTWRMLVAAGGLGLPRVKALCGAEELTPELAEVLAATHDQAWNLYGPTETTAWTTADRLVAGQPVSLGRPTPNSSVYLLDDDLRLVPAGVTGEICVGGSGLARGYLDRPGPTAARFVPDPFSTRRGARLYRTGDRARYRRDGSLEYHGRRDDQVKLRGHRIELGEVEAALRAHPTVAQAAVVLSGGAPAERQLVAYVVRTGLSTEAEGEDTTALIRHLRTRLPAYLVPAAWVTLDRLPVNASGKVDRRRLPAPVAGRPATTGHVAPRTPLEEEITDIAGEFLGRDDVGVTDDFFDLGGHSLLVARMVDKLRRRYGIELLLQDLFTREPNVEQLAVIVEEQIRRKRHLDSELARMVHRVGELPEDTVDALLEQLLNQPPDRT
ncbi:non-ribosomal peptide synthetase [Amycolatopsis magusensis]|uniref:non-ribosomal peptide synthetase n=1 Tax=Amycolatopsis magusensis TaxID=882444 RepID=UPI0024A833B5|nr:amino acid adenylation domain-containing protein [Amycolatopsis magusensis]MDI5978875.1 amino acid adenylation domain-containing protein [Amycolatopsis magusensis]